MIKAKTLFNTSHRRAPVIALGLLITLLLSFVTLSVSAISAITGSYTASENMAIGSIVSLEKNTQDQVKAASTSTIDGLLGVVINADSSLITLATGGGNQVTVATTGTVPVLVSDMNGDISRGDHITPSPLSGVGMKATSNARVIGVAQGGLDSSNGREETIKDASGKEEKVLVGEVPLLVNVSYYFKEPDKTLVPAALQNVANSVAGKDVNTLPIIISAAIFLVMLIVVASIIYSMIRSSIISIGRNPMSQSAIYRDMIQLSALVLAILAVGVFAIYLVLTRL